MSDIDIFLAITDTHFRLTAPESRTETDFMEVSLGKLAFLFAIAKKKNAKAILHSGDFFDRPDASPKVITRVMRTIKEESPCPIVVVPGNHDTVGRYTDSYKETALGVLEEAGCVKVLSEGKYLDFDNTRVYGFGWAENATKALLDGTYGPSLTEGLPVEYANLIGLIHARVGGVGYSFAENISSFNIKGLGLALFGDIHEGFDEYQMSSGCRAISVGSMVRTAINEKHAPSFLVIESNEKSIKYKKFEIPHKSHEEAFSAQNLHNLDATGFVEFVREARGYSGEGVEEFVNRICEKYLFPKRVAGIVLKALKGDMNA